MLDLLGQSTELDETLSQLLKNELFGFSFVELLEELSFVELLELLSFVELLELLDELSFVELQEELSLVEEPEPSQGRARMIVSLLLSSLGT